MKNYCLLLISLFALFACKTKIEPEKPEELYNRYAKSVVLIRNDFYYEIELNTGLKIYFTGIDNDELLNFTFKEEEIIENANTTYGTGFFVSKSGLIATNPHVAAPEIDATEALNTLKLQFENDIHLIETNIENKKREIAKINDLFYYYYDHLSYNDIDELKVKRAQLDNERMFWTELSTKFDFNQNKSEVRCISSSLSIAYNDTYATKKEDFKECVLKTKSEDN